MMTPAAIIMSRCHTGFARKESESNDSPCSPLIRTNPPIGSQFSDQIVFGYDCASFRLTRFHFPS